jgi:LmbE family N-acetylglucosaminyl deacetylase
VTVPWLVISPHFGDAVLSCGHLLAANPSSTVATVCGGIVPEGVPAWAEWDALDWSSANEATIGRRAEDLSALSALSARQICCDVFDNAYRGAARGDVGPFVRAVARVLDLVDAARIAIPIGGKDDDHTLTRQGATIALSATGDVGVYFYADLPFYRVDSADQLATELGAGPPEWTEATPEMVSQKASALACYSTRMRHQNMTGVGLGGVERLYRYRP